MTKNFCLYLLIFVTCAIMPKPTLAEEDGDADSTIETAEILDIDIESIEGLGLFKDSSTGAFSPDLWKNTNRIAVEGVIQEIPQSSKNPAIQKLIFGALLSETKTDNIKGKDTPEPGHDLFTLRIEKLLEMGAYKQAYDLYVLLETPPYHERLARAGILAALLNGEKSLACLDVNSLMPRFKAVEFWQTLKAFCNVTFSDERDEASLEQLNNATDGLLKIFTETPVKSFNYQIETFEALSLLEKAVLIADQKINLGDTALESIPASHIQILLKTDGLSTQQQFSLLLQGHAYGLIETADIEKFYDSQISRDSLGSLKLEDLKKDSEKISYLFVSAKNTKEDADRWKFVQKAFEFKKTYGLDALAPFAQFLQRIDAETLTAPDTLTILQVLNRSSYEIPSKVIEKIEKTNYDDIPDDLAYRLEFAAQIEKTRSNDAINIEATEAALKRVSDVRTQKLLEIIIKSLDIKNNKVDNALEIYEKGIDFNFKTDYVMPLMGLWDRLLESGQNRKTGETILLSAIVRGETKAEDIYPWLFADVLKSLNHVGLTDISRMMALEAVLEGIN